MSQCETILRHMMIYGQITTMDAFGDYGITRLSGRIWDLRKAGYNITSVNAVGRNRHGDPVHYTIYRLEQG